MKVEAFSKKIQASEFENCSKTRARTCDKESRASRACRSSKEFLKRLVRKKQQEKKKQEAEWSRLEERGRMKLLRAGKDRRSVRKRERDEEDLEGSVCVYIYIYV